MSVDYPNDFLDFNGDGKVSPDEEFVGFMMMQDATGVDDQDGDAIDKNFPDDDEYPR